MPLAHSSLHRAPEDLGLVCQAHCPDVVRDREGDLPSFNAIAQEVLRVLNKQITSPKPVCSGLEDHESLSSERFADIRTRFLLWTGNLGVMHKPEDPRSLDARLLDAPEVASRVRDILGDLRDLLNQYDTPCNCDSLQDTATQDEQPMDEEDAMMMQLLGLQTSKSCTASWLSASLDDTLRRLFHLSSLITKSTTRDKFARAELKCRLQWYEAHDIRHALEKITQAGGKADENLIKRLGKANTSRRQFLEYSHKHQAELSRANREENVSLDEGFPRVANKYPGDKLSASHSVYQSEKTKQSAVPTKASTIGPLDPKAFDYGLDDARSCTTVATSIFDGQAFSGLKVPELVRYAKPGEHFLCPLCQTLQRFNGQSAWCRHVFSDIRAYICTSASCGMLMFGSFNTWRGHEMDHRREWFCPLCTLTCQDITGVRKHLIQYHGDVVRDHQVDMLLQTSSRPPENLSASACPFCDWNTILRKRNPVSEGDDLLVPSRRFMKHLGRHLEEFALFIVPQLDDDDGDSEVGGSNAVHAPGADGSATMSTISSFKSRPSSIEDALQPEPDRTIFGRVEALRKGKRPGSITGRSMGLQAVTRHSTTPPPADQDVIHCICGFTEDDGNAVECDICKRWAHLACYYTTNGIDLPNEHYCVECRPNQALLDPHYVAVMRKSTERRLEARSHAEETTSAWSTLQSRSSNEGVCPYATCGKRWKDLKAHMLTHQDVHKEKCPVPTCEYHTKGFMRKYDQSRHTLTHYKGTMVCGFCPGAGSSAEKSFNRADVFKRHLASVHGVEQTPPNARRRSSTKRLSHSNVLDSIGICSTCGITFPNAQDFYEHLDDCILRVVQQVDPSASIDERLLTRVTGDPVVDTSMEKQNIPTLKEADFARVGPASMQAPVLHRDVLAADGEIMQFDFEPFISNPSDIVPWEDLGNITNFEDMPTKELDHLFEGQSPQSHVQPYTPYPSRSDDGDGDASEPNIDYPTPDPLPREVQGQHDGHIESFNCPVSTCRRHTGKGLSRMSGLVKHLATVHSIKTSASQVRDYHSALSQSSSTGATSFYDYNDEFLRKSFTCPIPECDCRRFGGTDELVEHLVVVHRLTKSQAESHLMSGGSYMLRDYHLQLMQLEHQNEMRRIAMQQEGIITSLHPSMLQEDDSTLRSDMPPSNNGEPMIKPQAHLHSEERREQKQLTDYDMQMMLLEQQNKKRLLMARQEHDSMSPAARQDYEMQLMLLEQQNKKRLLMARQEQESMSSHPIVSSAEAFPNSHQEDNLSSQHLPNESSSVPLKRSSLGQGSNSALDQAARRLDEIDRAEEEMLGRVHFDIMQSEQHENDRLAGVQSILEPAPAHPSGLQNEHRLEQTTLANSSNAYHRRLLSHIGGAPQDRDETPLKAAMTWRPSEQRQADFNKNDPDTGKHRQSYIAAADQVTSLGRDDNASSYPIGTFLQPAAYESSRRWVPDPSSQNINLTDADMQRMLAEQLEKKRLLMAREEHDSSLRSPFKHGSPLAPTPNMWMDHGYPQQAGMRHEEPQDAAQANIPRHRPAIGRQPATTIEPKDAMLDFSMDPNVRYEANPFPDIDSSVPLLQTDTHFLAREETSELPDTSHNPPSYHDYGHANQLYGHPVTQPAPSDRPFRCDQCPQTFNRNHDLKRHTRLHLVVKPFPCGHCDKNFSRKDALERHYKIKHADLPESGRIAWESSEDPQPAELRQRPHTPPQEATQAEMASYQPSSEERAEVAKKIADDVRKWKSLNHLPNFTESGRVPSAPILTQRTLEDTAMRPDMPPPAMESTRDFLLFPQQGLDNPNVGP